MFLSFLLFISIIGIFLIFCSSYYANNFKSKSLVAPFLKRKLLSVKKHLTLVNIITGLMCLILIVSIKQSGLPLLMLNILEEYVLNIPEGSEYFLASFMGLICRLGLKGLIEDGLKEAFPSYNAMTGAGDLNPTESHNSGGKENTYGGSSSSPTSSSTGVQKEESLSDKGKNPESASDSTTSSGRFRGNFSSERYVKLFDKHAQRINAEIKALSSDIANCKDEEERAFKELDLEELFAQLSMLSKESAAETRKILNTDSQSSNKRTSDFTVAQDSSKKRS